MASIYAQKFDSEEFQENCQARAGNGYDYFGYARHVTIEETRELIVEVDTLKLNLSQIKGMCEQIICQEKSNSVEEMYHTFTDKALEKQIEILTARDDRLKKLTEIKLNKSN